MKPGDFFLGILDFFAILLPGSLATWLVAQYIPADALRRALLFDLVSPAAEPNEFVVGAALLISSYMLGHFVFMAGSKLDSSYDLWRSRTKPTARDVAFNAARTLQKDVTANMVNGEFSTLKWAKAYIQVKAPAARVEIDRLEADSKFFRSLVVVAVAFAVHFFLRERAVVAGVVALGMAALAYQRYRDRRWSATELSYGTAAIVGAVKLSDKDGASAAPGKEE